jgi:protein-disulfide isomerase/uncharacterized membrane protein
MRTLCFILLAMGLAVSGHLLFRHFTLAAATGFAAPGTCSTLLGLDCDAALQSPMAQQLGLPLAGWGIVYYGTLMALLIIGWVLGDAYRFEATLAGLVVCALGAAISVVLLAAMLLGAAPFCPLCAGVHVINFLLVLVSKRMTRRSIPQVVHELGAGIGGVLQGTAARDAAGRVKLLSLLAGSLVAVILYQVVLIQVKAHAPAAFDVRHALASFAMTSRADIPCGDEDARIGSANAPVRLIVFTDFECPACRQLARELASLLDLFKDKVEIVLKHFPMSKACNPALAALPRDPHAGACELAWAAEAARRQGKFWKFHDVVLAGGLTADQLAPQVLAMKTGLDAARFDADCRLDQTRAKVKVDIDLGLRLGLKETPAIFVNGRRAPDVRLSSLKLFVASELANVGRFSVAAQVGAPQAAKEDSAAPDSAE